MRALLTKCPLTPYVQPRLDLHLTYVHGNSYTETGAGPFDLFVESRGSTTFAAIPAVEVGGRIPIGPTTVLRPFARVGIELNANGDWAATARFADQPGKPGASAPRHLSQTCSARSPSVPRC